VSTSTFFFFFFPSSEGGIAGSTHISDVARWVTTPDHDMMPFHDRSATCRRGGVATGGYEKRGSLWALRGGEQGNPLTRFQSTSFERIFGAERSAAGSRQQRLLFTSSTRAARNNLRNGQVG